MKSEMAYRKIIIAAPPFYSHFNPLLSLASAMLNLGADVIIASDESFRENVEGQGLRFRPLKLNRNSNQGVAIETVQATAEHQRLEEFFSATKKGPVKTLMTQAEHRQADMLPDPEGLLDDIQDLNQLEKPDLWILDQLSYGATLALSGLELPFITFCAPHPSAIPAPGEHYGVPDRWPESFDFTKEALKPLIEMSVSIDRLFTAEFNRILVGRFGLSPVPSAFRQTSKIAIVYNYPDLESFSSDRRAEKGGPRLLYGGHSVEQQALPQAWKGWVQQDGPAILIALGTFLSVRSDVIRKIIDAILRLRPETKLAVGAGDQTLTLKDLSTTRVRIESFIPQKALIPHVDLVVHHGGVSSFTETLYAGKPSIVLPFSSDQFDVARDVEDFHLGAVVNPGSVNSEAFADALLRAESLKIRENVKRVSENIRRRGPDWTARQILYPGGEL